MDSTTKVTAAGVQITGVLDMNSNTVTGLETDLSVYPIEDSDGASKVYVDSVKDEIVNNLLSLVDDGEF